MHRRYLWLVLVVLSFAGCRSTSQAVPSASSAPQPKMPLEIHWVRSAAEYHAVFEQTYRLAGEAIERRAAGKEPGTWAVAIDADETLISNSLQAKERAAMVPPRPFEEVWDQWVKRREAPALPGAKRFLERVRSLGGRIAVVTNRRSHHCDATADNLRALEMPFDVILCRSETGDKRPRWRRVQLGTADPDLPPLEILMWLGDNIHDFPDLDQKLRFGKSDDYTGFGDVYFVFPNPLYGSWEDNPKN